MRNTGSAPLAAHVIVGTLVRAGHNRDSISIFDAELEPTDSSAGKYMEPGQTAHYSFSPPRKPGEAFYPRVAAAVFADGRTEGEDHYVKRLLQRRRLVYANMSAAEIQLANALAARTPVPDVIADLSKAELARKVAATSVEEEMDAELVSETLISVLKNARASQNHALAEPDVRIQMALGHAKAVRARLAASNPDIINSKN